MSLATFRHDAATSAVKAFIYAKAKRGKGNRDMLDPAQNPDLRDDFVDLIADVLILARDLGLDPAYIARVGASHAPAEIAADDVLVSALAAKGRRA